MGAAAFPSVGGGGPVGPVPSPSCTREITKDPMQSPPLPQSQQLVPGEYSKVADVYDFSCITSTPLGLKAMAKDSSRMSI